MSVFKRAVRNEVLITNHCYTLVIPGWRQRDDLEIGSQANMPRGRSEKRGDGEAVSRAGMIGAMADLVWLAS